jgi:hypothetical protein
MAFIDRFGNEPVPDADVAIKTPCLVATTGAITLNGVQVIDGIMVGNNAERVLVKNQADQTTNGLYNAATGNWTRTADAQGNTQWGQGVLVLVTDGTANAGIMFQQTTAGPITLGTSNLAFSGAPLSGSANLTSLVLPSANTGTHIFTAGTNAADEAIGGGILWASAPVRISGTLSLGSVSNPVGPDGSPDEFVVVLESIQASTVGGQSSGYFKGPLFCGAITYDPNKPASAGNASNAITYYSEVADGVVGAFIEGIVGVVQGNGTGSANMICAEFDIAPGAYDSNTGLPPGEFYSGLYFKANLWCGNLGAVSGGWILATEDGFTSGGTYNWNNGILLRGITPISASTPAGFSGGGWGIALEVPNDTYLAARDSTNTYDVGLIWYDGSNILQIGGGQNFSNGANRVYLNGGSVHVTSGYFYTVYNAGVGPVLPNPLLGNFALAWNYTDGGSEVDFFNTGQTGAPTNSFHFYQQTSDSAATLIASIGPGMVLGPATGGDLGAGKLNVSAGVYLNDTAYTNPDYVFEQHFTGKIRKYADRPRAGKYRGLLPLAELEAHVSKTWRLPGIGDEPTDVFERADIALENLEQHTLYLFDHDKRIAALERRMERTQWLD